jgi:hypothetical protein
MRLKSKYLKGQRRNGNIILDGAWESEFLCPEGTMSVMKIG